jgi:hypothetical protein
MHQYFSLKFHISVNYQRTFPGSIHDINICCKQMGVHVPIKLGQDIPNIGWVVNQEWYPNG